MIKQIKLYNKGLFYSDQSRLISGIYWDICVKGIRRYNASIGTFEMKTRKQTCFTCREEWDAPDQRPLKTQCHACDRANLTFALLFLVFLGVFIWYLT